MTVQELIDRLELIPAEDRDKNIGYSDSEYGLTPVDYVEVIYPKDEFLHNEMKYTAPDEKWYKLI